MNSNTSKPKTYIIVRKYFMADYILDAIKHRPKVVIVHHLPRKGLWAGMLRSSRMLLGNRRGVLTRAIFPKEVADALRAVTPADRVLLWGVENYKYTCMMAAEALTDKVVSFLWNPMLKLRRNPHRLKRYITGMQRQHVDVCTFDPADAEVLGCRLVPQVFRRADIDCAAHTPRVFFIGFEKGREAQLVEVIEALKDSGIELDINIVRNKHHAVDQRHPAIAERLMDRQMTLDEVNRRIAVASAVIDICQPGQRGITLRTLEAQLYGKKLITNNPSVCSEAFYHSANIYILGEDTRDLATFLRTPFTPIDPSLLAPHDITTWLPRLFQ